ncbi:MAG: thioredoxin domain-containing protein [Acidobacteriaceae bacterium]
MLRIPLRFFAIILFASTLFTPALFAQSSLEKLQILKPPPGAKVAIVSFEDFQCPDCGHAHPLLVEMAKKYDIPLVRHDFPLPQHPYAMEAAIINRYLESKDPKIASEYRDAVYANQPQFGETDDVAFRNWVTQWTASKGVPLPFVIDPTGKFAAEVHADQDLGRRINIDHTPTIYIVTSNRSTEPFVEVVNRDQLSQMIEDAKQAASESPAPTARRAARKK